MAIITRNKRSADFSMASMSDLVFLLLIFFMLTSTMISPNAIKLLLPHSKSKTIAPPPKVTVYIDQNMNYYLDGIPIDEAGLQPQLVTRLAGETEGVVMLRVNFDVQAQYIVNVIDAVNKVNESYPDGSVKHKVIFATSPK
jgi:biopolymer transport protein ExbD